MAKTTINLPIKIKGKQLFYWLMTDHIRAFQYKFGGKGKYSKRDLEPLCEEYGFKMTTIKTTWIRDLRKDLNDDITVKIKNNIIIFEYEVEDVSSKEIEKVESFAINNDDNMSWLDEARQED